jgi:hypothetical protein
MGKGGGGKGVIEKDGSVGRFSLLMEGLIRYKALDIIGVGFGLRIYISYRYGR